MGVDGPNGFEHAETPERMLVAALIIEDGKLLAVYNVKNNKTRIEPPGGKVKTDEGETVEDAVHREPREELGIEVEVIEMLGIYETETPEGMFQAHMLLCRITQG
jgi:ADP-ribose pyrophosphatase YjhB (NUDIX family)